MFLYCKAEQSWYNLFQSSLVLFTGNCDALSKPLHIIGQADGYQESQLFSLVWAFISNVSKVLKTLLVFKNKQNPTSLLG